MPNRILRDWTDSEAIDSLDATAERFFTRLIMKVDDYGTYTANVKLLKSHLFPLKSDIRETDISRWLTACEKSGLIVLYNVANKDYLQIVNFKQVLRQKIKKYPEPSACTTSDIHLHSNSDTIASLKGNEVETEDEAEGAKAQSQPTQKFFSLNFYSKDVGNLTEIQIQAVCKLLKLTKYLTVPESKIIGMWEIFKIQNSGKVYKEAGDVYSHFVNVMKKEDFTNEVEIKNKPEGNLSAIVKQINESERLKNQANGK